MVPALFLHSVSTSPSSSWAESVMSQTQKQINLVPIYQKCYLPGSLCISQSLPVTMLACMPGPYRELLQTRILATLYPICPPHVYLRGGVEDFLFGWFGFLFFCHLPFTCLTSWSASSISPPSSSHMPKGHVHPGLSYVSLPLAVFSHLFARILPHNI